MGYNAVGNCYVRCNRESCIYNTIRPTGLSNTERVCNKMSIMISITGCEDYKIED